MARNNSLRPTRSLAMRLAGVPLSDFGKERAIAFSRARTRLSKSIAAHEKSLRHIDWLSETPYPIAIKNLSEIPVIALRRRLNDYSELSVLLDELRRATPAPGVEGALWHSCAHQGVIDCEAFVQVPSQRNGVAGGPSLKRIPAHSVASLAVSGGDDDIEKGHRAISAWLKHTRRIATGVRCELYLGTSHGSALTEIRVPL